jgi:hypothetical protein
MQTCDFVKRNGRCSDSCRMYEVSCLEREDGMKDEHYADLVVGALLLVFVFLVAVA